MKKNYCLMLGLLVAASAGAQQSTNTLPPLPTPPAATTPSPAPEQLAPAPVETTNAPAKKAPKHHHHVAKKTTVAEKSTKSAKSEKTEFSEAAVTLAPGPAEVSVNDLNVRGQAGLQGEVVAHLKKGESVTVISQINLDKHKSNEPSQWAKIALPTGSGVWVRSSFLKDKTVVPKKLNLRGGPSEDYSVLGVIERGTVVNPIEEKNGWTKIEPPANAFAYIAAMYLKQEASGSVPQVATTSTETGATPETNTIPTTLMTVATPQTPEQAQTGMTPPPPQQIPQPPSAGSTLLPPPTGAESGVQPNVPGATDNGAGEAEETNLPPRIVTHEGYVRDSISIVAPTYFELYDATTQNAIDYLHSSTTNLNLSHYNGFKIIVTGEEGMDARWKDTPVLTVQRIYVVSTNPPVTPVVASPRARTTR